MLKFYKQESSAKKSELKNMHVKSSISNKSMTATPRDTKTVIT